jgi:hypothetical protein
MVAEGVHEACEEPPVALGELEEELSAEMQRVCEDVARLVDDEEQVRTRLRWSRQHIVRARSACGAECDLDEAEHAGEVADAAAPTRPLGVGRFP